MALFADARRLVKAHASQPAIADPFALLQPITHILLDRETSFDKVIGQDTAAKLERHRTAIS